MREPTDTLRFALNRCLAAAVLLLASIFLVSNPSVSGTGQEGPEVITEGEAVRRALAGNHELEEARLEVARADARVQEAWGTALPRIDFNARYSRALKKPVFFLPDFFNPGSNKITAIEIGATHSFELTLSAEQRLFDFAVFVGVGAARIYSRGAREVLRSKEVEIATRARKAFYGVLVAADIASMMRDNLRNAEENLRTVRLLAAQGLASDYDLLRAEVGVANLRPEVINAENTHLFAISALKNVIDFPSDGTVLVEGSLVFAPVDSTTSAGAVGAVLEKNPGLAALRTQAEVNDAVVSAERSGFLPTISAFGNYQYVAQKNTFDFSRSDLIASSVVGLSMQFNIFKGLQTAARVEQAHLEFRKTQEQVASTERALQTAADAAVLQLRRARMSINAQEKTVEQARRGYSIASARYQSGTGTQLEVNDAQLALTKARVNRIQAVFDYLSAAADLDQLLGRIPEFSEDKNPDSPQDEGIPIK